MKSWNNRQVKRKCLRCGAVRWAPPSKSKRKFCSRACFYFSKFGNFNILKECDQCKKPHKVNQWKIKNHKKFFCSPQCRHKSLIKSISVTCDNCGEYFNKKISQIKRCRFHFCKHSCSEKFHQGRRHSLFLGANTSFLSYGTEWRAIRKKIRNRDVVCKKCGKTKSENGRELDVHHKVPFFKFGYKKRLEAHSESNLITLCRSCHKKEESLLWP